jgi:hypothetical protein
MSTGDSSDIKYAQNGQDLMLGVPVGLYGTGVIASNGGNITIDPPVNFTMASTSSISSGGGAIILGATGNVTLAMVDASGGTGSGGPITLTAGGNVSSAPGFTGPNLIGVAVTLYVTGNASLSVQAQALGGYVDGIFAITVYNADGTSAGVITSAPSSSVIQQVAQQQQQQQQQQQEQQPEATVSVEGFTDTTGQTIGGTCDTFGGCDTSDNNKKNNGSGTGGGTNNNQGGQNAKLQKC